MERLTDGIRRLCGVMDGVRPNTFEEVTVRREAVAEACDALDAEVEVLLHADAEAAAAWNCRTERTCRVIASHGDHGPEPHFPGDAWTMHYVCSACRGTVSRCDRYCKHCGARVVEHD